LALDEDALLRYAFERAEMLRAREQGAPGQQADRLVVMTNKAGQMVRWAKRKVLSYTVLRHELGHVLGFRHEHIRDEAPLGCPEDDIGTKQTSNLTPFDRYSVMHYLCGGAGSKELNITDFDRRGARSLYGPPDSEVEYVM
jgi:hypothetical protein